MPPADGLVSVLVGAGDFVFVGVVLVVEVGGVVGVMLGDADGLDLLGTAEVVVRPVGVATELLVAVDDADAEDGDAGLVLVVVRELGAVDGLCCVRSLGAGAWKMS